jgi:hypothetical protein
MGAETVSGSTSSDPSITFHGAYAVAYAAILRFKGENAARLRGYLREWDIYPAHDVDALAPLLREVAAARQRCETVEGHVACDAAEAVLSFSKGGAA